MILCTGADPWVIHHEGRFLYCHTLGDGVAVRRADSLGALGEAVPVRIWQAPDSGPYSREIWAPELHFVENRWYVYVAADDGDNANHRTIVLRSETDDPLGPYAALGKLALTPDRWSIDCTLLERSGQLYAIWSGWDGFENTAQNLYICPLDDPFTPSGKRVLISTPDFEWEKRGSGGPGNLPAINEGPQVLQRNDTTHVIYSAAGSWCDDYCLGRLTLLPGADPLDADAWEKHPEPVFEKTETVFGPGHCSFADNWIVYHSARSSGSGWDRVVRAQAFTWDGDVPNFGRPE
jgi:GH43 family beta-xylosidase